jgi:hypothetical protein
VRGHLGLCSPLMVGLFSGRVRRALPLPNGSPQEHPVAPGVKTSMGMYESLLRITRRVTSQECPPLGGGVPSI